MKQIITTCIDQAVTQLREQGISLQEPPEYQVQRLKHSPYGDYASNIAIRLGQLCRQQPYALAKQIAELLVLPQSLSHAEVGGPGFINFFISAAALKKSVITVMDDLNPIYLTATDSSLQALAWLGGENKVWYNLVVTAQQRIISVLRQIDAAGLLMSCKTGLNALERLETPEEKVLMMAVYEHQELCADNIRHPENLMNFLQELAQGVHNYYNTVVLLCEQQELRAARLCLLQAVSRVFNYVLHHTGLCTLESR